MVFPSYLDISKCLFSIFEANNLPKIVGALHFLLELRSSLIVMVIKVTLTLVENRLLITVTVLLRKIRNQLVQIHAQIQVRMTFGSSLFKPDVSLEMISFDFEKVAERSMLLLRIFFLDCRLLGLTVVFGEFTLRVMLLLNEVW